MKTSPATALCLFVCGIAAGIPSSRPLHAATAVETLYAELAKLPADERTKRLTAGATKEGTFSYIETITSKVGSDHEKLFNKAFPAIKTKVVSIGSKDAAELFVAEETAGRHLNSLINMFVPDMGLVIEHNIPATYVTPAIAAILPQYKALLDPGHRWVPWEWSEHGLTYNAAILKGDQAPTSYWDLCKPELEGLVSFDSAETRFLFGMYKMLGEEKLKEWLQCMGKNKPIVQDGHTTRLTLMLAGDHAASPDQYFYRGTKLAQDNPKKNPFKVAYEAPVIAFANGLVINRNAAEPYAAALYADWSLGPDSQEFMKKQFRGPVTIPHPYMPDNVTLVPLDVVPSALADKLFGYWNTYIGKSR